MLAQAICCFIFVAVFASAPLSLAETAQVPLVERGLELDTPEKAVETFVALHRAGDFESLWFVIDPALRRRFTTAIQEFELQHFVGPGGRVEAFADKAWPLMAEHSVDPAKPLFVLDGFPYFAAFLTAARELQMEAFDFSGTMPPVGRSDGSSGLGPLQVLKFQSSSLGQVAFELRQAPSKRWRVYSVAANVGTPMEFRWKAREE